MKSGFKTGRMLVVSVCLSGLGALGYSQSIDNGLSITLPDYNDTNVPIGVVEGQKIVNADGTLSDASAVALPILTASSVKRHHMHRSHRKKTTLSSLTNTISGAIGTASAIGAISTTQSNSLTNTVNSTASNVQSQINNASAVVNTLNTNNSTVEATPVNSTTVQSGTISNMP